MIKESNRKKSWTPKELEIAVAKSTSIRQVLHKLGLVEAGGNYSQIKKFIELYKFDNSHFKGKGWSRGLTGIGKPIYTLSEILVKNSSYQSFKLKKRLFQTKLKSAKCEKCGWAKRSQDGRLPLELDHINGDKMDNRIENLQILCPNCHSLQPTHRGKNIKMGQWRNRYTRNT